MKFKTELLLILFPGLPYMTFRLLVSVTLTSGIKQLIAQSLILSNKVTAVASRCICISGCESMFWNKIVRIFSNFHYNITMLEMSLCFNCTCERKWTVLFFTSSKLQIVAAVWLKTGFVHDNINKSPVMTNTLGIRLSWPKLGSIAQLLAWQVPQYRFRNPVRLPPTITTGLFSQLSWTCSLWLN